MKSFITLTEVALKAFIGCSWNKKSDLRRLKCLHNGIILIVICFQYPKDTKHMKKNKTILGLDLGTNSIGWALIEKRDEAVMGKIIGAGSRIIPMSQDVLGKFDSGVSISQTAERTGFRSTRRLRERHLLRRERLHRVLHTLGFLPKHYAAQIDFEKKLGQFLQNAEPKIAYCYNSEMSRAQFVFKKSFHEMIADFASYQPLLVENGKKIPYDWTIYYLRKKALCQKIEKEELAWLLLNFNQKRGYYQLRGEEEDEATDRKVEFHALGVTEILDSGERKNMGEIWYNVILENGWVYRRTSKVPLDWVGKIKEFIVTTDLNQDGSEKRDKEGKVKRSFRSPAENDWTLMKKKTEHDIAKSNKTVGEYIYNTLLQKPNEKIKGKLVRTIERKFYKEELKHILQKQQQFHHELQDKELYNACVEELYENNEVHKHSIGEKDFTHLFLNDIIYYQRPLKSKKSLISKCKFEQRVYIKDGKKEIEALTCIAKSHPLYQEFRLWKFIQNLHIIQREKVVNGRLSTDVDVTEDFLSTTEEWVNLFDWLNTRMEIEQKDFFKYPAFNLKKNINAFRWNYVEDKKYPCNETRVLIQTRLNKIKSFPAGFLTNEKEEALWHILYSVEDKNDLEKALNTFANKNNLGEEFIEQFKKFPPFKKDYGSYSAKAVKKLLPLMRMGKYWNEDNIQGKVKERIEKIISGEFDEKILTRVRDKAINLNEITHFEGLPEWLASYIVYNQHSEDIDNEKWETPDKIELLPQHSFRNPIVEQVINETLQVVRDIWKQYGNSEKAFFDEIHIELGREMKNTKADREKVTKQVTENENTNLRIKTLLVEMMNDVNIENVRPYSPMQQDILKIYEEGVLNAEYGNIPDEILKISKMAQPTQSEVTRYKLWLQQKYRSPYTNAIIPLNKLFTPAYEIEHIIPQSRYFDNSFTNKVICESAINKLKDNRTALEFILDEGGRIVDTGFGEMVLIFKKDEYERFVSENYSQSRSKMKRLLMEEIPEAFIQRQLNDTRYISKVVKNLMSKIVRQDDELETVSKNIILSNGAITSTLKQDWGLNDVWNEIITPRFERLNELTNSRNFGEWVNKDGKRYFQTQLSLALQKGFTKKRIDHRHHALDALVIACTSRDHINYLNNQTALGKKSREEKDKRRYDLRNKLCDKKYNDTNGQNYNWIFKKPWPSLTQDCKEVLYNTVVSFKQTNRVINKAVNHYQKWVEGTGGLLVKQLVKQENNSNWAIRKPMHKDTVSGLVKLKIKKIVPLSSALDDVDMITDREFKKFIKELKVQGYDKKKILQYFKEKGNTWNEKNVSKVEAYYWDVDTNGNGNNAASRVKVNEIFNSAMIKYITDTGIQNIMLAHLNKYNEVKNNKVIEHPEIAFSPDGLDELNKYIQLLNNGKPHQPIYKVRTYEPKGNKFNIGQQGNKKHKYVEAAKGTNLFFAIYQNESGKRNYITVPFNIVIERQMQGLYPVPQTNENGDSLLMSLSPNDLVYVPTIEEITGNTVVKQLNLSEAQLKRVYKFVSCTGNEGHFVPHYYAKEIVKNEVGANNKSQNTIDDNTQIKMYCIKLQTNRLGNIKPAL